MPRFKLAPAHQIRLEKQILDTADRAIRPILSHYKAAKLSPGQVSRMKALESIIQALEVLALDDDAAFVP